MINIAVVVMCCICSLFFFAGSVSSPRTYTKIPTRPERVFKNPSSGSTEKTILSSQLGQNSEGRGPSYQTTAN